MNAADACLEAERLAEQHRLEEQRLRAARRKLNQVTADLEASLPRTDLAQLKAAKAQAQREYRQAYQRATDAAAVQQAAATWLGELSRLNRAAGLAARQGPVSVTQLNELEAKVRRLELEVDASRIRAETARERCNEARRAAAQSAEQAADAGQRARLSSGPAHEPAITLLLRGNRLILQQVASRLAEETELDAGRLQLLIIELCEQIAASALEAAAIAFPPAHPLWSQFEPEEARSVTITLTQLGYRFDGRGGWLDGRVPATRQLAYALAHVGLDGRLRQLPSQAQLGDLWQGARLQSIEHLVQRAPDLSLEQLQDMLGVRGTALDELWDNWSHVRRALLS